jgi:uncharacterized GH25 family protein
MGDNFAMKKKIEKLDETLETLLDLNGEFFPMDNGYWTKFEVYKVDISSQIPQGIRYSLTLHDKSNRRVLGFDNAHAFTPKKKKFGARKITWDHKHNKDAVSPYEYESAGQLLEDFWLEVESIIEK